jgi:hypothetical protein
VREELQRVLLDRLRAADHLDFSQITVDASHMQAKRERSSPKSVRARLTVHGRARSTTLDSLGPCGASRAGPGASPARYTRTAAPTTTSTVAVCESAASHRRSPGAAPSDLLSPLPATRGYLCVCQGTAPGTSRATRPGVLPRHSPLPPPAASATTSPGCGAARKRGVLTYFRLRRMQTGRWSPTTSDRRSARRGRAQVQARMVALGPTRSEGATFAWDQRQVVAAARWASARLCSLRADSINIMASGPHMRRKM